MGEVFDRRVMVLGLIHSARGTNCGVRGRQGGLLVVLVLQLLLLLLLQLLGRTV